MPTIASRLDPPPADLILRPHRRQLVAICTPVPWQSCPVSDNRAGKIRLRSASVNDLPSDSVAARIGASRKTHRYRARRSRRVDTVNGCSTTIDCTENHRLLISTPSPSTTSRSRPSMRNPSTMPVYPTLYRIQRRPTAAAGAHDHPTLTIRRTTIHLPRRFTSRPCPYPPVASIRLPRTMRCAGVLAFLVGRRHTLRPPRPSYTLTSSRPNLDGPLQIAPCCSRKPTLRIYLQPVFLYILSPLCLCPSFLLHLLRSTSRHLRLAHSSRRPITADLTRGMHQNITIIPFKRTGSSSIRSHQRPRPSFDRRRRKTRAPSPPPGLRLTLPD